tara:strand:- start:173 stop:886 length:714 start_codon:yes stop_codon:yes gene_type:complete
MGRVILGKDSKYTTSKYKRLVSEPFKKVAIKPLREGHLGSEYNTWIADYSKEKLAVTDRLVPPSCPAVDNHDVETMRPQLHGNDIYAHYQDLLKYLKPKSILDLACGDGELLHASKMIVPEADLFGVTIHYGEVLAAKEKYNIELLPADMRDIDTYFNKDSFDLVVIHAAYQNIVETERVDVARQICQILKKGKHFLLVDYRGEKEASGLNSDVEGLTKISSMKYFGVGDATLYEKV